MGPAENPESILISGSISEMRETLVALLLEKQWPRDEALMAVDLAIHAMDEAVKTIVQICERAEREITQAQAMCLACEFTEKRMTRMRLSATEMLHSIYGPGDFNA